MDGFTIANGSKFLNTGSIGDNKTTTLKPDAVGAADGKSFSDTLKDAVGQVNELQKTSDKAMQALATGKTDNIPEVMMAAEKADIAVKLMVQVRNKIIEAYQDVMKMQV
ncbi:MAG: flagellar hook-basal body complex protein FliE [Pseudobdellovibrionaceae bacterium]